MASNTMDFIVRFRDEASAGLRRLQATVNQINGGMNGAARSTREFSRESELLSRSTRNASNSNRETSESLRSIGESSRRARSEIRELTGETGNYRDANGRLRNANGAFIKDTERSTQGVKGFGMSLKGLGPIAAAAGGALAAVGMASFAKDVMSVGIEFDSAISEVSALSGAQGDALQSIRDKAKEIGSTTSLSASEAASAFKYMSLAGWDAEQMLGAVDGVAQLAIASGEDLGAVADIVTDGMSAFGLEASKATMFADTLAKASTSTNTDVAGLGEGFKYSAASAHSFGMEVHETAAALGTFANAGIKGSSGGTVLNAMLRDMKSKSKDGKIAIGQTAVAIYDAAGNARGFSDILADVEKATVGMTGAQKDAALAAIFGDEAMRGVNIALGEGSDKLKELEKDFKNSEGAAARMGEVMNDNLGGDLKGLASAWEGFKIALFDEGLGDFARPIIQGITGVIQTFPKGISKAGEFFKFIKSEPKEGAEALTEMGKNIEKFGAAYPILEKLQQGFSKIREKAVEMKGKVNAAFMEMSSYIEEKIIEYGPTFERMGEIFTQAKDLVVDVLTELWSFAGPILNILGTALRILGDVAMTVFAAVIVPAIDLFWTGMQNAWSIVQPILEMMKTNLETAGEAMTWLWENAGQPLVTFLGGALKLGIDTAKAAVEAFSGAFEWLGDKISAVTGIFGDMKDKLMSFKPPEWVGNLGGKISGAVSSVSNFIAGSHATGLERVGYDGYVAELHKGESVLTAKQSQALRNAGMLSANADGTPKLEIGKNLGADNTKVAPSNSTVSNNFTVNVNVSDSNSSADDIGRAVRREIDNLIKTTRASLGTA